MTLENFTKEEIVLIFPANYAKLDQNTNELNILECVSMLNVLDSSGRLFIFDLDQDQFKPEQELTLIPEPNARIVEAKYNMKSSMLTACYMHDNVLNHLSFNMRAHKKKITKLAIIRQNNEKLVKLLKISFVNN